MTVKSKETFCHIDRIQADRLEVSNMAGEYTKQAAAGSQVLLQARINNDCSIDNYPVTIIFEVRDSDGMTDYLTIQQVRLSPSTETFTVGSSGTAENPGEYTFRVLSISCLTCLGILIPSPSYEISVN